MTFTPRTSGYMTTSIETDLADNNAGLISAEDLRSNIGETMASINIIVASGNTNTQFPFLYDVRAKKSTPSSPEYPSGGLFIPESGIWFPNAPVNSDQYQVQPFLGAGGIQHDSLGGLTAGDPHTQYVSNSGHRPMTGNLPMGANWVGPSGYSHQGIGFTYHATGITIKMSGTQLFPDNSIIKSGRGVAKAWIIFDGSGNAAIPVVKSAYNITALNDLGTGKFRLTFTSGVLGTGHYVAIGHSNARTSSGNLEDFDVNTVGTVSRSGVDPFKSCTFAVLNMAGQYVDAEECQVVVFADGPNVTTDSPTVS